MLNEMMAYCGTYCGTCDWKEKMNCKGCKKCEGSPFWGKCKIALCAIEKGYTHCGECKDVPCGMLNDAFNNKEHSDNGERLQNLINWAAGKESMLKVTRKKDK